MKKINSLLVLLTLAVPAAANAQSTADDVSELRQLLNEMRQEYESRISDLEERLLRAEQATQEAQREAKEAQRDAEDAVELAEETAIEQGSGASSASIFNPAIGFVLNGAYVDADEGWAEIPGFQSGGEIGTGEEGFTLGEAEINLKANIDSMFFGNLTVAVIEEDGETEVELEESWIQTTDLPHGVSITGGRFFSSAGYLNNFHFHADDFVDRPLPYQAFLGGRYSNDGVQVRWVAPTALLVELGAEFNWGDSFPATSDHENSPGAYTLFTKFGGDVGDSHSWQLGLSHVGIEAEERSGGEDSEDTFSGDSDLAIADFVWKWAPQGNPDQRNLKLQGEYFYRSEDGDYAGLDYDEDQSGWYLQSVWQFAPAWRVGLRHDRVDADSSPLFVGTELEDPGRTSRRESAMVDWSPSEFSRIRLQYNHDRVERGSDDQIFLQYIFSIGAHGAHQF